MTDAEFWLLIDTSRERAKGSSRRQEVILREMLRKLAADDIAEFNVRYDNLIRKAYHWDLWGAAYIIGGGCSDDGFWDFRSWLVSRGQTIYEAALRNPESLIRVVSREDPDRDSKGFLNPAIFVWAEMKGRPAEDCPGLGSNLGETPTGEEWADDKLPRMFPRLWGEFGE
jgi:hypothetical protein